MLRWLKQSVVLAVLIADGVSAVYADSIDPPPASDAIAELQASFLKCREHLWSVHGDRGVAQAQSRILSREIEEFQQLVEQSLVYREESIRVAARLKSQSEDGIPLSGADLDLLNWGMAAHLQLRKHLYDVAEAHECWLSGTEDILGQLSIAPHQRYEAIMLSLAAALVLYDNYLLAVSIFQEDAKLRRFLNQREPGYSIAAGELSRVANSYHSPSKRARAHNAIQFYERYLDANIQRIESKGRLRYLNGLIQQSPSYSRLKKVSPLHGAVTGLRMFGVVTADMVNATRNEGLSLFSMLFGNTVGLVETRKGKLFDRDEVRKSVHRRLAAGDILLEKTPFRLTDHLIPGYWGHAAVWIGTEQELSELGIWNHHVTVPFHSQIRQGSQIVEALRPGVQMNRLAQFLNVDDLMVLRVRNENDERRADRLLRTLRQVGKPYDFNFDVETTHRIVCSELIYQSVTDINWPTQKTLGRSAISPDHIVSRIFGEQELEVIVLYHDGVEITSDRLGAVQRLMSGSGAAEESD